MQKGLYDFLRFLSGIEDRHREYRRKKIIEVSRDEIAQSAQRLFGSREESASVILAGTAIAEKAAKTLGLEVKSLPI